jgi:hypothetical protein
MATLLSSLFIFNTQSVIDEGTIQELSIASEIPNYISFQDSEEDAPHDAHRRLAANAPRFLWIIRDFIYQFNDSPKEYMENVLKSDSKRAQALIDKTREAVVSIFQDRD